MGTESVAESVFCTETMPKIYPLQELVITNDETLNEIVSSVQIVYVCLFLTKIRLVRYSPNATIDRAEVKSLLSKAID